MNFPGKTQNNKVAIFLVGAIGGIAGSALTALWVISGIWAAVLLVLKKLPWAFTRSDLAFAVVSTVYFLMNALSAVATGAVPHDFLRLYPVIVFLLPWLVIPRLRLSEGRDLIGLLALGAGFCGLLALPLAAYQSLFLNVRAEGGAGNPIPFAFVCSLVGQIALLNTTYKSMSRNILGWLGYYAGLVCVLLSVSRGPLITVLIGPILLAIGFPKVYASFLSVRGAALLAAALVVLVAIAQPVYFRSVQSFSTMSNLAPSRSINADAHSNSNEVVVDQATTERIELWKYAAELIYNAPFLGYGTQNRVSLVREAGFGYGHFHNGFLTSLVDTGVQGLIAMVALLFSPLFIAIKAKAKAKATDLYRERLFLAATLVLTYAIGGLTNYIFWHDIYDNLFLWIAAIVAASVPVSSFNPLIGKRKA